MTYRLLDIEAMARRHPDTFLIASRAVREGLQPGDLAKLIFEPQPGGPRERMWVRVDSKWAGGYAGTLDNQPARDFGLKLGDSIDFGPEHIADWQSPAQRASAPAPPAPAPASPSSGNGGLALVALSVLALFVLVSK